MKVITFNVGLLVYDLLKYSFFSPVPFVKERLNSLPKALVDSQADLICLQEIYHIDHKAFLFEYLKEHYPYSYYEHKGFRLSMENGLMVFSKTKLDHFEAQTFELTRWEERIFACTGFQKFTLSGIDFIHLHLTAGGLLGPEHSKSESLRANQIEQLFQNSSDKTILLGDFNCGPRVSKDNYQLFLSRGFTNLTSDYLTWDPSNPLNKNGIHKHCPPQSIDHVMANFSLVSKSDLIFTEECVYTNKGKSTLSDHYGILVKIKD